MSQSDLLDPGQAVDLTNCDREPIHIPGAVQPHGVLFVVREPELTVSQVSASVARIFGVGPDAALGAPLSRLLGEAGCERLRQALLGDRVEESNPVALDTPAGPFDALLHRHLGATTVELEPARRGAPPEAHHPLRTIIHRIQRTKSLRELFDVTVKEVRALTGFERVMIYRFDEEGHGEVIAEARLEELQPYLGHRYPASDIPRQARQLYLQSWLRIIPDAVYEPALLVPPLRVDTGAPLDLSLSVLRAVSPIHLEFLRNMGVRASMSVSLIQGEELWGLISCIDRSPRYVAYEVRSTCEVLGRIVSLQIAAQQEIETRGARERQGAIRARLFDGLAPGPTDEILALLLRRPEDALSIVGASGAVAWSGEERVIAGSAPPEALVKDLIDWLEQGRVEGGLYATSALSKVFSPMEPHRDVASGLLAVRLPRPEPSYLLWFRPEVVQTVSWGGDPTKPVDSEPGPGGPTLHPRRSFELWKEVVRGEAARWTASDLEAAADVRRSAIEEDLRLQVARERRAVRARDDVVAVVSHDLRTPLSVVRMASELLHLRLETEQTEGSRQMLGLTERIQRSTDRMEALIQDLLDLAKIEAGRFSVSPRIAQAQRLIHEALVVLRPLAEGKGIQLTCSVPDDLYIQADPDRFFQILSNLVGNAVKHTPRDGSIWIAAESTGGQASFLVRDTGPGIPAEQQGLLFDRYWQARRDGQGVGLGLYIAKGIVDAHGGRMWVDSRPGHGATFLFTLPLATAGDRDDAAPDPPTGEA